MITPLALQTIDNQNGTVAVSASGPFTATAATLVLYTALVDDIVLGSGPVWSTLATVNYPGGFTGTYHPNAFTLDPGYYWFRLLLTVVGDGSDTSPGDAADSLVYGRCTAQALGIYDRIVAAAAARVALLAITWTNGAGEVRTVPIYTPETLPQQTDNLEFPCFILTGDERTTTELGQLTSSDDMGYPVFLTMVDTDVQSPERRHLFPLWRMQIERAFRSQVLAGVNEVLTCTIEPEELIRVAPAAENYKTSDLVLRFRTREPRGLGA